MLIFLFTYRFFHAIIGDEIGSDKGGFFASLHDARADAENELHFGTAILREVREMGIVVFKKGDKLHMKKPHVCGSSIFEATYVGSDVKIRCLGCGR